MSNTTTAPAGVVSSTELGLLPIGPHDHPEPRTMMWSALELAAIKEYAARCVAAERERCAALCRRAADETRNSEDARAAGRMLANWISTGDPNDPRPNTTINGERSESAA